MVTRTVMCSEELASFVSVDNRRVTPQCITRFGTGTRVEVRKLPNNQFAVKALAPDSLSIFGEETWEASL